jgi:hypothetical protein
MGILGKKGVETHCLYFIPFPIITGKHCPLPIFSGDF